MIDKLAVAQRLLARLRAAGAALRSGPGDELAPNAGWELADAALIAQALAGLTVSLPRGDVLRDDDLVDRTGELGACGIAIDKMLSMRTRGRRLR
jgi:hypothetical protein